jgi:peptidyl-prolyl cis-trans isomerase SurA
MGLARIWGRKARVTLALCALPLLGLPAAVTAQGLFSPVITVNDSAITGFELSQRQRLLEVFRTPGDSAELAREGLIEDRLKMQELSRAGLRLESASLRAAMEEFAGRADLTLDQFLAELASNGVEEQTLRDYVEVGVSWRDYVRTRFGDRVTISEADIDQALGQAGGDGTAIEVLLSEIIIPSPPAEAARVLALAQEISRTNSTAAFESAAREYSALPSRDNGGRLDWVPLGNFPEPLRPLLLALAPGEVTAPLPIEGAVALFQLRDLREVPGRPPEIALVDYAVYFAAGAQDAARALALTDACDDLYAVAQSLPAERLLREEVAPAEIPQDIALELARLDSDEISTALSRDGGATVLVVMLCSRTPAAVVEVDREAVRNQLRSQRLAGYADALLADLRASAIIIGQ